MSASVRWLALGYNVPINPSKNRVYVWRKLKEFGAEYFKQGVAVLPMTPENLMHFKTLAQKIRQTGGEASLVELRFLEKSDETQMTHRFKQQIESEYSELLHDCAGVLSNLKNFALQSAGTPDTDKIKKMVKRYQKARSRDYFHSSHSSELEQDMNLLVDSVRIVSRELSIQLKKLLEKNL